MEDARDINRQTLTDVEFLGEVSFETGFTFEETEVGRISGINYDAANNIYYALDVAIDLSSAEDPDPDNAPDADDLAIYVHPKDPEQSFVITTFKNGGLRVINRYRTRCDRVGIGRYHCRTRH